MTTCAEEQFISLHHHCPRGIKNKVLVRPAHCMSAVLSARANAACKSSKGSSKKSECSCNIVSDSTELPATLRSALVISCMVVLRNEMVVPEYEQAELLLVDLQFKGLKDSGNFPSLPSLSLLNSSKIDMQVATVVVFVLVDILDKT